MAPTIGVNLRVTGHCNQGDRKYMEDMFSVAYQQTEDELDLEYAYFGIFDGHGGHEAATFAKEHLMKAIVSQSGFWSDNDKDILRAIKEGFIATHYAMWRNLENWPRTQSGWPSTSGTTASIAFIRRSNIYIGHVGDSCIVLGYQDPCTKCWKGAPLTMDHKPENPIEQRRINQAGGMVLQKSGVPRVVWHRPRPSHKGPLTRSTHFDQIPFLAVARSLGDLWSYNPDSDRFVVSPEPDVSVHRIDLSRDRCLIFGTDGLWNMLSPQEAVNIVEKAESNNKNSSTEGQDQTWLNPSKCLVDSALYKWTKKDLRADNTSAVTLLLDPLGPPQSQVLDQQNFASQSQSDFVPYHIESYKISKGKSPDKAPNQTSGLAVCTWYPQDSTSEGLNKNDGLTTLSTMEELYGEKVEMMALDKKESTTKEEKPKKESAEVGTSAPSTSKTFLWKLEKKPASGSAIFRSTSRSSDSKNLVTKDQGDSVTKAVKDLNIKVTTESDKKIETSKSEPLVLSKQNSRSAENVSKSKNRPSSKSKEPERTKSEEGSNRDSEKANFHSKSMKRSKKKAKKRKKYDMTKSEFNVLNSKRSRSKSKRRHSSLIETINIMYEPRPKRRTRSEDLKKNYEGEGLKSDAQNAAEGGNKLREVMEVKTNTSEADSEEPETCGESTQNQLQERLHSSISTSSNNNNNNNDNNSNNNNSNNNNSNNNNNNNNNNNGSNNNNNNNGSNNNNNSSGNNNSSNNASNGSNNDNNNRNSDSHNNSNSNGNNNDNDNDNSMSSSTNNNNSNNYNSQDFASMQLRSNMPDKTLTSTNINFKNCDWLLIGPNKIKVNPIRKSLSKQSSKSDYGGEVSTAKNSSEVTKGIAGNSLSSTKPQISQSNHKSMVYTRSQNKRFKK